MQRDFTYVDDVVKDIGRPIRRPPQRRMRPGDVPVTYADVDDLVREVGFHLSTSIEDGIAR
jgi:UDP-glucuronate 4-epimerase